MCCTINILVSTQVLIGNYQNPVRMSLIIENNAVSLPNLYSRVSTN